MKTIFDQEFKKRYERLNKAQKEAVDTIEGPVMVVAGPGTGKTTIITLRIANILQKTDTPASGILALTFTESGVRSLKEKLAEIIGARALEVRIHTFHGFASSIISEFPEHFTHIHNWKQITQVEAESLVRKILEKKEMTPLRPFGDPEYYVSHILRAISECKREAMSPEMVQSFAEAEIERLKNDEDSISSRGKTKGELKATVQKEIEKLERTIAFSRAFEYYEEEKKKKKVLDYDDLIFELLLTLGRDELLKKVVQEKFLYLHIDEHQDTNDSQNLIMKILADFFDSPNICIVGDEKQAIYRFQGASVENFLTFEHLWPMMKIIKLEENYRSHQSILDASFAMIEKNYEGDAHQDLRVRLKGGQKAKPVDIVNAPTAEAGLMYMKNEIGNVLEKTTQDVAVIARNNKEVDTLITFLEGVGIPVSAERSLDIYTHPIGVLFFALVKVILDKTDIESLGHTIAMGLWGLTFDDKVKLLRTLRKDGGEEALKAISVFNNIDKELLSDSPIMFLHRIAELSGLLSVVSIDPLRVEVWRALLLLSEHIVREQELTNPRSLLEALLLYEASPQRRNVTIKVGRNENRVKVMTAHRSKGLEFDYVFIPYGVDELWSLRKKGNAFILPMQSEITDEDTLRDARRLFYVSLTRAKSHAVIIVPECDSGRELTPLRFISELDPEHVQIKEAEEVADEDILIPKKVTSSNERLKDLVRGVVKEQGISVTALNHFLKCPSQFVMKSILKVPEMPSLTSEKGNAMHLAMSEAVALPDKSVESLTASFESSIATYLRSSLLASFEKQAIRDELYKHTEKIARSLYSHFSQDGTMHPEHWYEAEVGTRIHGKLDLVVEKENEVLVYDYKTRSRMSVAEIKGETQSSDGGYFRQLVFYKLLLQNNAKFKQKGITPSLIFLVPDKNGALYTETLPIEVSDIEKLKTEIDQLLKVVDSGEIIDLYCEDKDCVYCPIKRLV